MDILVKEAYVKKARVLHEMYPVVDAHLDLAGEILIRNETGEEDIIRKYYLDNWKRAGINLVVSSIYVPTSILTEEGVNGAWENTLQQINALESDIRNLKEVFLVKNREDLKTVKKGHRIGILVYMEGLDGIGTDISRLKVLYDKGARGASLTWSRQNALATGCCKAGEYRQISGGLTKAGKEAVKELERLSMFVDISHLNDDGFADIVKLTEKPFLATHSCAKSVYDNYRNLTDEQMDQLAGKGGVMGLNGCKLIAGSKQGNHLEMLCRHAEYEVQMMGENHVGYGFDLCDAYDRAAYELQKQKGRAERKPEPMDCFCNHSRIPLLTAALLERGMEEKTVIQIIGGNFMRYFETVLPTK